MSLMNENGGMVGHDHNPAVDSLYMALNQAQSEEERRSIKQLIDKMDC